MAGYRWANLIDFLLNRSEARVNRNSINWDLKLTTIRQIKAARALLGWSQSDLAHNSGISEPTIARLESVDGQLGGREETIRKIRAAFETRGIEFIEGNGGGSGVRVRKRHQKKG
jgi:transcriptional regulator with XRE-family HTH domain